MALRSVWSLKVEYILILALFGCLGPVVKAIPLPAPVIACLRAWISFLFIAVYLLVTRKFRLSSIKGVLLPMLLSGACLTGDWIGLFQAYRYTTVATATVCYYMAPIFVFLVSPLILKERFTAKHAICAGISFIGMVLVSGVLQNGSGGPVDIRGILFALLGAVSYAAIVLLNKKYPAGDPVVRTMVQLAMAAILMTPYILLTNRGASFSLGGRDILLLLALGIVLTAFAYIRYFAVIVKIPARTVSIFAYADPVVAVLLSIFFLNEPITPSALIGSALIIFACIFSELG